MSFTLQKVFEKGFSQYANGKRLPPHFYKAANKFINCRTAALGGHITQCSQGHVDGIWYNSCKHRFCPQCNEIQKERWLEKQRARLLDTAHHHIIFTLPHQLESLWLRNTTQMMNLLFKAVRDTLMRLLRDEPSKRFLDALPGFICAFHSWGRALPWHPHIHCLIADGGLGSDGSWQRPKGSCFIPVRIVRDVFRGKFLAYLRCLLEKSTLNLPDDMTGQCASNLLNKLGRVKWNVNICERYDHGSGVVTYMARYVRGGALKNGQLLNVSNDSVTFRYYSHQEASDGKKQGNVTTLPIGQFIQRYLMHVPEPGVQTVRSYGLYASSKQAQLNTVRAQLGQDAVKKPPFLDWQQYLVRVKPEWKPAVCTICGGPIEQRMPWQRSTDPPPGDVQSQGRGND